MPEAKAPTSKLLELIRTGKSPVHPSENQSDKPKKTDAMSYRLNETTEPSQNSTSEKKAISINSNFHKVPNIICDKICVNLTMPEEIVYRHMIRLSWGWNRNWCHVGNHYFQTHSSIKSRKAIGDAIKGLLKRGLIKLSFLDGKVERNNNGTVYIVPIPNSADIIYDSTLDNSTLDNSTLRKDIPDSAPNSILGNSTPVEKPYGNCNDGSVLPNSTLPNSQIKDTNKDSLKDTLSQEKVIQQFYKNIGHKNITKAKRESAEECLKELLTEGFSLEDVSFAIKWTLKNLKEQPYDFSILKHTISQAMTEKEEIEEKQARLHEQEQIAIQKKVEEERLEKERIEIEAFKEKLNPEERGKLRQRALEQISNMEDIRKDFVTEALIRAKENEIVKAEPEILRCSR